MRRSPPFSSQSEGTALQAPAALEDFVELAYLGYPLL
jgi:hypothetical protein